VRGQTTEDEEELKEEGAPPPLRALALLQEALSAGVFVSCFVHTFFTHTP